MEKKRPAELVKKVYISDRQAWHFWLAKNFNKEKSIWLVHDKRSKGGKLGYDDIVEEALCFGWIDSTLRSLDENQSMIYLSVRKPKSIWAQSNKNRVEHLTRLGLMQPAGLAAVQIAKENGSWTQFDAVENLLLPDELKNAFAKSKKAAGNFEKFSVSLRKQILYHIYSAKQSETREKRVEKLVPKLEANKNPFI